MGAAGRRSPVLKEPFFGSRDKGMSDEMLGVKEAAKLLNLRPSTLYEWVAASRIPFYRISARRLGFQRCELEQWLRARRIPEAVR